VASAGTLQPVGGWTRRRLLRRSLAGAVGAAGVLGPAPWSALAAPRRAARAPAVVRYAPWGQWPGASPSWQRYVMAGLQPFLEENPNVEVRIVPPGGGGSFATPILAGQGPDVFEDWVIPPYLDQGLVANLQPFIQQDNLSLDLWSPGQMRALSTPSGVWFLPAYVHVDAMAINLSDLDARGLSYPDPDWTYEDAERLYRATTWEQGGQHHYGYGFDIPSNGGAIGFGSSDTRAFFLHWFGGALMDATRTRCVIDAPEAVQAVEWLDALVQDQVATSGGSIYGPAATTFAEVGSNNLPYMLQTWRNKVKWTFFPVPRFPAGQFAFEATDYHAMNAQTPEPEAAWLLLRFLAADPRWSRYTMKVLLRTPSLVSLWDEYERTVLEVAPVAQGKGVHWFTVAAERWGVAGRTFRYLHDQAIALVNQGLTAAVTRQMSAALALRLAAQQVNALEASGAVEQGRLQAEEAQARATLARVVPAPGAAYPAPSVSGFGTPPGDASAWVVVGPGGVVTLLGDGEDVWNASDNAVFACAPATASVGEWTCRVTAISDLTCALHGQPALSPWLKVGIMARADLSDDAPMVALAVTGAHGLQALFRPVPGIVPEGPSGLLPAATGQKAPSLTAQGAAPPANLLLRPIWLRLRRVGADWTALASWDGVAWTALGPVVPIQMAAVWVGVFACAHNADFTNQGYIRATFDRLSFQPSRWVQLGQAGVPPAAGPVPPDWATRAPLV
jgi:ABC-type glycerol-3-phosphate transport system substrate-binding protein